MEFGSIWDLYIACFDIVLVGTVIFLSSCLAFCDVGVDLYGRGHSYSRLYFAIFGLCFDSNLFVAVLN